VIGNIEVAHLALGRRGERAPRRLISTAWLSANPDRIVWGTDWPRTGCFAPHPGHKAGNLGSPKADIAWQA
jgi:hypothetical protein